MWLTIEPFLLEAKRRKIGENMREGACMSNRYEGTCAGRYDANKVDNTPQLQAPTACVVRKTEEGTTVVKEKIRRLNKNL